LTRTARKRVLMLLENNPFLIDVRPRREAQALLRAGYRVSVIAPRGPSGRVFEVVDGVHVYEFPSPPEAHGFLGYLWEYGYATLVMSTMSLVVLLREGFDILHAHNPPDTFFPAAVFYKLLGKRFVYDHHDLAPELYGARFTSGGPRGGLVHDVLVLFEKLTCRLADHVIVTNESSRQMAIGRGRVPPDQITIVRNGPDLTVFRPMQSDPTLRAKAETIIGYAGRMGTQDGLDYLLKAMRVLVHDLGRREVLCILVGEGEAVPHLRLLAQELDIEKYLWFVGWVPQAQIPYYLSAADICVAPEPSNPYNDRSTMIKIMEYMALEKPTVAFDLPEHRVSAGDAALYARPNDERDLARLIALLIDDPERRRMMALAGRQRVETQLAWMHEEKHLLQVYETVCAGR